MGQSIGARAGEGGPGTRRKLAVELLQLCEHEREGTQTPLCHCGFQWDCSRHVACAMEGASALHGDEARSIQRKRPTLLKVRAAQGRATCNVHVYD